ncbi:MAG: hypothetical protein ACI9DM_002308, partial [Cyclobacteriaceae bacterium]
MKIFRIISFNFFAALLVFAPICTSIAQEKQVLKPLNAKKEHPQAL